LLLFSFVFFIFGHPAKKKRDVSVLCALSYFFPLPLFPATTAGLPKKVNSRNTCLFKEENVVVLVLLGGFCSNGRPQRRRQNNNHTQL
jgi:hypothetical protein